MAPAAMLILAIGYYFLSTSNNARVSDNPAPAVKKQDTVARPGTPPVTAATLAEEKAPGPAADAEASANPARVQPRSEPSASQVSSPEMTILNAATAPSTKSDSNPQTPISSPRKITQMTLEAAAPALPVTLPKPELQLQAELALWEAIKNEPDAGLFEGYLKRFPDGQFTEIARAKLDRLRSSAPAREVNSLMDLSSWEILDGRWWMQEGALLGSGGCACLIGKPIGDLIFEAVVEHVSGPRSAIGFGARRNFVPGKQYRGGTADLQGNSYNFTLAGIFSPFVGIGSNWYFAHPDWKAWKNTEALKKDRVGIRVEADGPTCRFFVDNQQLDTFIDDRHMAGPVLLWVQDPDQVVRFSDIRLTLK